MKNKVVIGSILLSCFIINDPCLPGGRGGSNNTKYGSPQLKGPVVQPTPDLAKPGSTNVAQSSTVKSAVVQPIQTNIPTLWTQAKSLAEKITVTSKDFTSPELDNLRNTLTAISRDPGYSKWLETNKDVFKAACEKAWPEAFFVKKLFSIKISDNRPEFVQKL